MEETRQDDVMTSANAATHSPNPAQSGGLDEALFKLLNFQAQQGADQNYTMIMLALINLLGIVNCMERMLPEGVKTRGAGDLANQIAGALGVPNMPLNNQGAPKGGLDPALMAALASMLGGPRGGGGPGEPTGKGGIDPALIAALASMVGGPGNGPNPAALMGMLANMMGPGPMRPVDHQRKEASPREEKPSPSEEKPNQVKEPSIKESTRPQPRGILRWDPRL